MVTSDFSKAPPPIEAPSKVKEKMGNASKMYPGAADTMLKIKLETDEKIASAAAREREMERRAFAELVAAAGVKGKKEEGRMGKLLGELKRRLQPKHDSR